MDILNQVQICDLICSSGQPTERQFSEIASAGYECVINLAMPDHEQSLDNEGAIVTSLGMTYIHIPVPFDAPTEKHLLAFSGYMNSMKDRKVWVHCIVNARVSAFLFRYLQQHLGLPPENAVTPILEAWIPSMDNVWRDFIGYTPTDL